MSYSAIVCLLDYFFVSIFLVYHAHDQQSLSCTPTDISVVMGRKIYVRQRQKISEGVQQPQYRIAAVVLDDKNGPFLQINASHFRKKELESIAADIQAEIVYLESEPDEDHVRRKQ